MGEFWRGEITLRTLRVLVAGLPLDSAMHRAYPQLGGWRDSEHLAAYQIDVMKALLEMARATADSKDNTFHAPEPFPRPADQVRLAAEAAEDARREREMRTWWKTTIEVQIREA